MEELLATLGSVCAVIGAQWGDEGKGKVIDILGESFDVIARAAGGANAGHTIVVDGKKHVFHLLPAASLHEGKPLILGSAMVIHLPTLLEEVEALRKAGIDVVKRLYISEEAHIVFEYHKAADAALEEQRAKETGKPIGTTKRGIGPAAMEKAARTGMRMGQWVSLLNQGDAAMQAELRLRATMAKRLFGVDVSIDDEMHRLKEAFHILGNCVTDMAIIHRYRDAGKTILIEGAQAALLDIDHGTYPYVTSGSMTSAGALQGLSLPPNSLTSCIGVAKAYCTRVGEGPFPTELTDETGERLRKRGGGNGATTGRPRRCGWLSLPDLVYAARMNGFTGWNITKRDVLDEE